MKALPYLMLAAGLATSPAWAQTADYIARGNEPGWILTIAGKTLTLESDYGASKLEAIEAAQQPIPGGYRYAMQVAGQSLTVEVLNRLCRDDMSGMSFPDAVTVTLGDRVMNGCGGDPASLLQRAQWMITTIDGKDVSTESRPFMVLDTAGRVSGHASCNSFGGAYKLSGEGLSFSDLVSTKRACGPPLGAQENAMLSILRNASRHEFADDGTLIIESNDGHKLVARKG